jgi:hypothetical protein
MGASIRDNLEIHTLLWRGRFQPVVGKAARQGQGASRHPERVDRFVHIHPEFNTCQGMMQYLQ